MAAVCALGLELRIVGTTGYYPEAAAQGTPVGLGSCVGSLVEAKDTRWKMSEHSSATTAGNPLPSRAQRVVVARVGCMVGYPRATETQ